ncbi:MAG: twin transmembrane helix small protein [Chromatiales bacterium]|nr:twin transmembrane helix small protein [Chromatiales bacterium]
MWLKIIVLILFLAIIASLSSALFTMIKNNGQSNKTVNALTLRVALSIITFVLLIVGYAMGWIQPHGLVPM